ncbi:ABC transporter ATP-binding protein [Paenibacillus tarimensis]|uniref:ABC transporter ATP-binding protein n=1 Tax=Paenibacillus tarimensis TaxID=416012 RepID=UPI001EFF047B|nr:ABC transporter transmembrane domain-containing protein [Paenibacillus tarimensis]MCF2944288.1 ATP-binding cassette domain-containing protein [Paenibacillus tarimensis]
MLSVMGKLGWFFKLEKKRYIIAVILMVLSGILEILPPMMVGSSIDAIQLGTMTWSSLTMTLVQLALITAGAYIVTYFWMYKLFGGSMVVERMLRSKLMRHFMKMTPTFYERSRTGDLMARATNDLQAVSMTAGFGMMTLIDSTLWMGTLLITMTVFVSWKLTLAAILPLPIMALLVSKYGDWIHKRFTAAQDAFGAMNDDVLETVSGVRVTRAYVQERAVEKQFDRITQDVLDKNIAVVKIDALFEPTIKILVGASYLIGLGYGAYLVYHNEMTIGGLVAFNVYLGMLIWPMFAIGELINVMQRGNASIDRVNETLGYKPDVPDPEDTTEVERPTDITFENVTFRYPSSSVDNLKNVTFTLKGGQTLGIVGRTGSGKSTLIKQLLREYPHGEGMISVSGVPIERISMDQLKSWYGYVPQEQFLFSRTVRDNIRFARDEADDAVLDQAMEASAFKKDLRFLPGGLETMVGEKGVALSGGQKQRVSIARALIAEPEILLLDDAMSAVDARTEAEIIENIRSTRQGKTTLITTHRLSAVQHADWIIVLDEGEIIEQGTHETLMAHGGWYREQYERQQIEEAEEVTEGR